MFLQAFLILWLILASQLCHTLSQEGDFSKKGEPPDKLVLRKATEAHPSEDQQSWMSKIFSWVLPFGSPAEDRGDFNGGSYQYLPAAPSQSHIEKDCNPCNEAPWVPMTSVGEKTIVNYVPPPVKNFGQSFNDLSVLEALRPPSAPYQAQVELYRPPPQFAPQGTINNFGLNQQGPIQNYAPPNRGGIVLVDYMVPPPVTYKVPSLIYGPPKPSSSVYGPPPVFREPKPTYQVPYINNQQLEPQTFITPPNNVYIPPAPQNYAPPPISVGDFSDISHHLNAFDESYNRPNVPSDSYGAPVTGDSLTYFAPPEQLSLGNEKKEYLARPIPLPNLSSYPVLPFRNHGEFRKKTIDNQQDTETQVNIQESVRVADWLDSIEHPINIVQSPLIELSIKDENENSNSVYTSDDNSLNEQSYTPQTSTEQYINTRVDKAHKQYDNINQQLLITEKKTVPTKLSENPIVIEDVHAAASSINDTFVNSNELQFKRSKDDELIIPNINKHDEVKTNKNQLQFLTGSKIIKEMLLNQKNTSPTNIDKSNNFDSINNNFTMPPLDYGDWTPTYGVTMSTLKVSLGSGGSYTATTKKAKPLQIIVPYISNKSGTFNKDWTNKKQHFSHVPKYSGSYTTLLPVFVPPDTTQISVWPKYNTVHVKPVVTVTPKTTTAVYNIKELFNLQTERPYDVISLQKHIDDWTHQAYSHHVQRGSEQLSSPKEIPSEYFTTQAPVTYFEETTIKNDQLGNNLEESERKEDSSIEDSDIDTNLIVPIETTTEKRTTTTESTTKENVKSTWDDSKITISPLTKEKVYIVTPQTYSLYTSTPVTAWSSAPKIENGKVNNDSTYDSHRFTVRVAPQNKTSKELKEGGGKGAVKIVFSEWPHLINNLETTTKKPSWRHPLFGLMDILSYTPPPNSTVETIFGHSRVATAVTSPTISEKETT